MESDGYAGLAVMVNLGHWFFAKHIDSVDFDAERDAVIYQLRQGLHELISTLKRELPGIAVWMCPETCVRIGRCGDCHRFDHTMFRVYYEKAHLDEREIQRIREGISGPVKRLSPLSEEQERAIEADIAQTHMIRIGTHGTMVEVP